MDVGTILRTWRADVAHRGQADTARALNVTAQALNQWEHGVRAPTRTQLRQIDDLYTARGALLDLCLAVGTAAAFEPRLSWSHNFTEEAGPVWAWLRPASTAGQVLAELSWGPVHTRVDEGCSADGLFVASPVSPANPPLHVRLDAPGWVDFGRGVPPTALGLPIIDAAQIVPDADGGAHDSRWLFDATAPLFARLQAIFRRLSGSRRSLRPYFSTLSPLTGDEQPDALSGSEDEPGLVVEPSELRRIREARNLSREDVAREASKLDRAHEVDAHIIRNLEHGRSPRVVGLLSRLDMIYRADGRLGVETVRAEPVRPGLWLARFPEYWIGPVWVNFASRRPTTEAIADVVITWFPWRTRLRVHHGTSVTFRRATFDAAAPEISVPPGWLVQVGVGLPRTAHDVNADWRPAGRRAVVVLLRDGLHKASHQTAGLKSLRRVD
jgi:transcriptional regulator with XRE-family HTH domain